MCRDCGYTVKCKNCNITMTYHIKTNKLKCHYCGHEEKNLSECPECHSTNFQQLRRVTGYLTDDFKTAFNLGKQDEVAHRVKHASRLKD